MDTIGVKRTVKALGREPQPFLLLLTLAAAARTLGISRTTIHKLVDSGRIGYVRVGADRRIPYDEIPAFIERNKIKAGAE